MKSININSIVQAYENLPESQVKEYFDFLDISPKDIDLQTLKSLIELLKYFEPSNEIYYGFFFGFEIPQISKEFDLLRIGKTSVINTELKSSFDLEKIEKQLIKNRYYLSFLDKEIHLFTYVSENNKVYKLDKNDKLIEFDIPSFINILDDQQTDESIEIEALFNPSNYLVSPFNSTDEFMKGAYFLTAQQEEIKLEVIKRISESQTAFIIIRGKPGTGKSLLTYDIARDYIANKKKVLVVHCGIKNAGHHQLYSQYKWEVVAAKSIRYYDLSKYHLVVVDESQRIWPAQLNIIIDSVSQNNLNCIFSYDMQQWLREWEAKNNIEKIIMDKTDAALFTLSTKIRTNKEIALFIACLFNMKIPITKVRRSNIELSYFNNYEDAKQELLHLKEEGWKIINFTPSRDKMPYNRYGIEFEKTAHEVIGQEFDNVAAIIDQHFYYNSDQKLDTRNYPSTPYYHPTKMLYQTLTRTRKKLHIVIVRNEVVLSRCLDILRA